MRPWDLKGKDKLWITFPSQGVITGCNWSRITVSLSNFFIYIFFKSALSPLPNDDWFLIEEVWNKYIYFYFLEKLMKCGQLQGADKNQPTKWGTDFLTGLPNVNGF